MNVFGVGNVTQVNYAWAFTKDENGKQGRIKTNVKNLTQILETAHNNYAFYSRMHDEIMEKTDKMYETVCQKYVFITDEDIEAELKKNGRSQKWFDMTLSQRYHNEECIRKRAEVSGYRQVAIDAGNEKFGSMSLARQASTALKKLEGK